MKVTINGEETELSSAITVTALVESLGLTSKRVAVEINRDVLSRERWNETTVQDSDHIEIVQFVGGG
jgi:thiamine biosynthesis protein ThiS